MWGALAVGGIAALAKKKAPSAPDVVSPLPAGFEARDVELSLPPLDPAEMQAAQVRMARAASDLAQVILQPEYRGGAMQISDLERADAFRRLIELEEARIALGKAYGKAQRAAGDLRALLKKRRSEEAEVFYAHGPGIPVDAAGQRIDGRVGFPETPYAHSASNALNDIIEQLDLVGAFRMTSWTSGATRDELLRRAEQTDHAATRIERLLDQYREQASAERSWTQRYCWQFAVSALRAFFAANLLARADESQAIREALAELAAVIAAAMQERKAHRRLLNLPALSVRLMATRRRLLELPTLDASGRPLRSPLRRDSWPGTDGSWQLVERSAQAFALAADIDLVDTGYRPSPLPWILSNIGNDADRRRNAQREIQKHLIVLCVARYRATQSLYGSGANPTAMNVFLQRYVQGVINANKG